MKKIHPFDNEWSGMTKANLGKTIMDALEDIGTHDWRRIIDTNPIDFLRIKGFGRESLKKLARHMSKLGHGNYVWTLIARDK